MMEYEFVIKHYENGKHIGTDYIGDVTSEEYVKCMKILVDSDDAEQWEGIYRRDKE